MFAEVIVDITSKNTDTIFEYSVPERIAGFIGPGMRVLVPFGSRSVEGFVMLVKETNSYDAEKIKPVLDVLDDYSAILPEMLELAEYIKDKYHCTLAAALRLMIPAEMRRGRIKAKQAEVLSTEVSADNIGDYILKYKLNPEQTSLVNALISYGASVEKLQFSREQCVSVQRINTLVKKGVVKLTKCDSYRVPYKQLDALKSDIMPTQSQQDCIDAIGRSTDMGQKDCYLLRGITGSGKTEVYMRSIATAISQGKTALMLVPEIALTPQMMQRFRERFGQDVAVLHSGLSVGERFDEWRKLRLGMAHIAVGARSAIFSPLQNVGIIIIDEEHENTYRSETNPRYDALTIAKARADYNNAVIVLGSATPSIIHYKEALEGKYKLLELNERVNIHGLPDVEVVDMRSELMEGNRSVFSRQLFNALSACIGRGEQAILFLNRRGYSTFVMCRACSYVVKCDACDVALNYHIGQNKLVCHYCNTEKEIVTACPECGSPYIKYFGAGTQKIEEAVKEYFPDVNVLRMDIDTTRNKDAHVKLFSQFASGKAQILIGTQMVAKGLDFPNVTLVGVMAADSLLHMPDYASAERTFQLITQVSGRAGRDAKKGKVIVQTYTPEHYAIEAAANQDYISFYNKEIEKRKIGQFPPFTAFMRIVFVADEEAAASRLCREAYREAQRALKDYKDDIILLTCMPAPVLRIKGQYRYQIVVKAYRNDKTERIADKLYDIREEFVNEQVSIGVEIEPITLI